MRVVTFQRCYSFNSFGHTINQMFCVLYEQTCPFTLDTPDEALFSFWFTGFQHLFRGVQIWALGWPTHSCNPIVFSPPFRQPASVLGIVVLPQRPPTAAAKGCWSWRHALPQQQHWWCCTHSANVAPSSCRSTTPAKLLFGTISGQVGVEKTTTNSTLLWIVSGTKCKIGTKKDNKILLSPPILHKKMHVILSSQFFLATFAKRAFIVMGSLSSNSISIPKI